MRDDRWIRRIAPLLASVALGCGGASASTPAAPVAETAPEPEPVERAAPDDVEGLARELATPAYREEAVGHLRIHYERALRVAEDDRDADGPRAIVAQSSEALADAYLDETDPALGLQILELLLQMGARDAWPAFERALDWRAEATEEHAVAAARAMRRGLVDDAPIEARAEAAARAALRIEGARPVDNRMRVELLRALGAIEHPTSREALATIAERLDEEQNFLINRLALEELGDQGHPSSVPTMIRALFRFRVGQPQMRMNDVAAQGLGQIGRPALQPALELLAGQNAEASAIAQRYIDAVREVSPQAAATMSADVVVAVEASYVLGQLGFADALDPLLAESRHADEQRRSSAALALVGLSGLSDAQERRVRDALHRVYGRAEPPSQLPLLVAMQHTYDDGHLPLLLRIARDRDAPVPDHRVIAARAHALLGDARESRALRRVIERVPDDRPDGLAGVMQENLPLLDAAARCDEDVACWRGLLDDDDPMIVRKALHMLARLDAPWPDIREPLLNVLAHGDTWVRSDALYVIDHLSEAGDPAVVERIETLRAQEEGRSRWQQIREIALTVRSRQRARMGAQP